VRVILIHMGGRRPPAYLRVCARQVERVTGSPPIVIGPWRARGHRSAGRRSFRRAESLSEMGLHGFWRFACERFFVLEEVMRKAGLPNCLHMESDNLMFVDPADYEDWASEQFGDSVAICPLTDTEDTASVMYVGSLDALREFNAELLELVALHPEELLSRHGGGMANEMRMLRILRERGLARAFPITLPEARQVGSRYVFDPASYGQNVDGTPGEPGVAYAGDHHVVGRQILSGECWIRWDDGSAGPLVVDRENELPLANLHIHSKRLERFAIAGDASSGTPASDR
jgi:hypothetical protein